MKTVTLFGDSILYGIIVNPENLKYAKCPDYDLRSIGANFDCDLLNISQMGRNSSEGLEEIKLYLTRHPAPDYAIIEFGGNDCDHNWIEITNGKHGHVKIPKADFVANLTNMVNLLQSYGTKVALMNMPPVESESFYEWVARDSVAKSNIKAYLGDVGTIYSVHESYSLAINKLATTLNIPLIDIRSPFGSNPHDLLCVDGVHPNEKGYALIKEKLEEYLKSL